jgi:hypothetical protein
MSNFGPFNLTFLGLIYTKWRRYTQESSSSESESTSATCIHLAFIYLFFSVEDGSQGLMQAKYALYHWANPPTFKIFTSKFLDKFVYC